MTRLAALVAVAACVRLAAQPSADAARLFKHGVTFDRFLAKASAQRDVWLRTSSDGDVNPVAVQRLTRAGNGLRLLVVAEDWCVDSAHTVPYVARLAAAAGVELRIVDRDLGAPLMARHTTRDGRPATPTIVLIRNGRDVGAWVERPAPLQDLFFSMATNPDSARRFADRASWYDLDRGRTAIAELLALAEGTESLVMMRHSVVIRRVSGHGRVPHAIGQRRARDAQEHVKGDGVRIMRDLKQRRQLIEGHIGTDTER
jgi:hypothetical protein